jgi:Arc/MetJ-type ribon-helix-helix transcriptional regulator
MKRKIERKTTKKLSISLPVEMVAWLEREAEVEENGNTSAVIRRRLQAIRRMEDEDRPPLRRAAK